MAFGGEYPDTKNPHTLTLAGDHPHLKTRHTAVTYWQPDVSFVAQACSGLGHRVGSLIHAFCAAIWRDACLVKSEFVEVHETTTSKLRKKAS